ncbi:MAG: PAS domain S-box protein [Gemmatales bacterium]
MNEGLVMKQITRNLVIVYAVVIATTAVATGIRFLLDPLLGDYIPYATFFVAVVIAAWVGGLWPALLTVVLGLLLSWYFFVPPRNSFDMPSGPHLVGLVIYVISGLAIAGIGEAMRFAQQRTTEQGEQLRTTLASIGDAVITTDMEGRITNLNPVAESLTGWKNAEAVGQPLDIVFHIVNEDTRKPVENPAFRALKEGVIVGLANHTILIGKDKTERPIDDSAAPIRRETKVTGAVLVFRDVSERRRLEKQLMERLASSRILASIVESSDDAIISKSLDGTIRSWNAAAERLFGYTADEAVGQHISLIIPADRADEEAKIIARIRAGDVVNHFDTIRQRSDGESVHVSLTISPIRDEDGCIVGASKNARDISERRQAERLIANSEARKAAILETALDCIITIDHVGRIVEFNPAAERTFGYRRSDVIGHEMAELIVPSAMREQHRGGMSHYMVTGEGPVLNRRLEMTAIRSDGTEFPVELSITRIPGEGPPFFTGYLRDITERRKAEQERQDSERAFRSTIEQVKDYAIFNMDQQGRATSWNEGVRRVLGFDEVDFIGKDIVTTVFTPEDVLSGVPERELEQAATTGTANDDRWMRKKDGTRFYATGVMNSLKDEVGKLIGFTKVMRDQTEGKRMEDQLRASESQQAAESASLARLNEASTQLWRAIGLSEGLNEMLTATIDLLGADMGNIQLLEDGILRIAVQRGFKPDFLEFFREVTTEDDSACGRTLRAGSRTIIEDIETDTPYEPLRPIARAAGYRAVQSTPLMNRDGKPLGMISTHFRSPHRPDEQELRRLDMYVRQSADFIERTKADLQMRQLAAELSEADRRKNEFLAMLAHELRNPLAPIRNSLQILRRTAGNEQVVQSASEMMERQVGQMVRLVDDLLDISRISRGKIELRKERVELGSVLNHVIEATRPSYDSRDLKLTVTLPQEPVYLYADQTRLAQVVGNLLNNACKFTKKGGEVSLTVTPEAGYVCLSVKDNGIGISSQHLPRIFDMFMQIDTTLERSTSGLGIGLTLVKNLVEMHNGTVEARSGGLGQGSEFVVVLPVIVKTDLPPEPSNSETTQKIARRILVVDDNRDSATSLALLLNLTGNETQTAYDGLEAVEVAATFQPDIILLDIGLPKLNGYEVARKIRTQEWSKGTVLVALTGWGQEEDRQRSRDAGFDGHMVKPVEYDALMKLLDTLSDAVSRPTSKQ